MGHNINEGRMMYVGEKPWHGIGTELKNPATAKEAIEAARLDYDVELVPMYLKDGKEVDGMMATYRVDTKDILGFTSEKYKIIQNVEAFNFFDSVIGQGQAVYQTAGALGKGERIWLMAKLPKDLIVAKDDVVEKYLLLTTSHDGTSALKMYFTPIRVVCQNTLMASLRGAKDGISIRHRGDISFKVKEAQRILGIAVMYYEDFNKMAMAMANKKMNTAEVDSYYNNLLVGEGSLPTDTSTRILNVKDTLLSLYESGKGNNIPSVKHSLWTAYNAVTEYADHYRTVRNEKEVPTNRLDSIWFGTGASMKQDAFELALSLIK